MKRHRPVSALPLAAVLLLVVVPAVPQAADASGTASRIRPDPDHPAYWNYRGQPVLLLGGSVEDNLFQIPDLEAHLDLLQSVGGNYVRCTMSCRDDGNVWPFKEVAPGRYDLDQWNEAFWERFERFLRLTAQRDIIVQIELWATFDYYRDIWERNPFNPKNNVNYTAEETRLPMVVNSHPTRTENNFFWSVPAERNQPTVLRYQRRFVDRLLDHALPYGNVLYCMDNETSVTPEWGWYWSGRIRSRAGADDLEVQTTEMWDAWDLAHAMHNATFDHPRIYSFVDISQNNHQKGQAHWDNLAKQRARIAGQPRPLNNVKIYGADTGRFGATQDGQERFWRSIFGGCAAARFHRPDSGLGLGEIAQANLRSARLLTDRFPVFTCRPAPELLGARDPNEAYALSRPGEATAVY
ncbi:MAG: hypothetical protein KDM81_11660 [Verrucomicrobiae bacterium]|nr:hypothetical protein [Verrucomicrobiae bacterium]